MYQNFRYYISCVNWFVEPRIYPKTEIKRQKSLSYPCLWCSVVSPVQKRPAVFDFVHTTLDFQHFKLSTTIILSFRQKRDISDFWVFKSSKTSLFTKQDLILHRQSLVSVWPASLCLLTWLQRSISVSTADFFSYSDCKTKASAKISESPAGEAEPAM